jgi:hypothetical protein
MTIIKVKYDLHQQQLFQLLSLKCLPEETDMEKTDEIIISLQSKRKPARIDIHEFRLLKSGNTLHIDCHITLAYYRVSHTEPGAIEQVIVKELIQPVEVYMHTDPCKPGKICGICSVENRPFTKWILLNKFNGSAIYYLKTNSTHSLKLRVPLFGQFQF